MGGRAVHAGFAGAGDRPQRVDGSEVDLRLKFAGLKRSGTSGPHPATPRPAVVIGLA